MSPQIMGSQMDPNHLSCFVYNFSPRRIAYWKDPLGRLQAGILRRMRRTNKNITIVGDDAQSIYSFRAADIHNILDFPKQFPGTEQITLEQNYRSRQPILDATNHIIALANERYTKDLWSVHGGEQKPLLVTCEREEEQTGCMGRPFAHAAITRWFRQARASC